MSRILSPRRVKWFVLASLGIILVSISGGRAAADSPAVFGWWTTENPGLPSEPIPTLVPTQPNDLSGDPNPDIPSGGFEVTDIGSDTSYAAIGYSTYGSEVSSVTLKLASSSADIPNSTVEACPLTGSGYFSPDQAAPVSQGPPYSCALSIQGVEDSSKEVVTFQVSKFVHNGYLGIAIVASGSGRLVFDAPDSSTIQAQPPPTSSSSTSTGTTVAQPPSGTPSGAAPTEAPSASAASIPTTGVPTTTSNAVSPAFAVTPTTLRPRGTSAPSALVAVSTANPTIGIGDAAIGAALVVLVAVGVSRQNHRRIRNVPPQGNYT
jgi:hypothetical protein